MPSSIRGSGCDERRMSVRADTLGEIVVSPQSSSILRDTLRNILRQRSAVVGLALLGFLLFTAVFADVIASRDPDQVLIGLEPGAVRRAPPCIHLLGCPAERPEHL